MTVYLILFWGCPGSFSLCDSDDNIYSDRKCFDAFAAGKVCCDWQLEFPTIDISGPHYLQSFNHHLPGYLRLNLIWTLICVIGKISSYLLLRFTSHLNRWFPQVMTMMKETSSRLSELVCVYFLSWSVCIYWAGLCVFLELVCVYFLSWSVCISYQMGGASSCPHCEDSPLSLTPIRHLLLFELFQNH